MASPTLTQKVKVSPPDRSAWPYTSPFWDPLIMDGQELAARLKCFTYNPTFLHCLAMVDNQVEHYPVQFDTEENRTLWHLDLERQSPVVTAIFVQDDEDSDTGQCNLSVDSLTWQWMLERFQVHPTFLWVLGEKPGFKSFVTYVGNSNTPEYFHLFVSISILPTRKVTIYLKYHFTARRTFLLVSSGESRRQLKRFAQRLAELEDRAHPFDLMLDMLMDFQGHLRDTQRGQTHNLVEVEKQTRRNIYVNEAQAGHGPNPETFDTPLLSRIGAQQLDLNLDNGFMLRLCEFMQSRLQQFTVLEKINKHQLPHSLEQIEDTAVTQAFQAFALAVVEDSEYTNFLAERTRAQLQAADTLLSLWIAKQSQQIAVETRKDSTSMKTLAGLTMVYLPSTFIATVFGMGFFNFGADGTSPLRVQTDIWKFIIISLVLTAFTMLTWAYLNSRGVPQWFKTHAPPERRTQVIGKQDGKV